ALLTIKCWALPAPGDSMLEELWLAVELNGQQLDDVALYLRGPGGRVLAPVTRLKEWRIRLPQRQPTTTHNGEQYLPLETLAPGLTYQIDEDRQVLVLKAPPESFERVTLRAATDSSVAPSPPPLGGFLNYDLVAAEADSHSQLSGLLEASVFGPAGAGVVRYLARREIGPVQVVRLDTTWTRDEPAATRTFRIGDSITGTSAWGGAVRFGGIQWASNYTTRPGFITMPLPGIGGESALPSTVDVYVNNMLRLQNNLPSGPFHVADVPIITGEGD